MIKFSSRFVILALLGVVSRTIPHPANFTLVGGMAVYLGKTKRSVLAPILAMVVSDAILGFDSLIMRLIVYGAIVVMYWTGRQVKNLWLASILASWMFFVVTNAGVWLISPMYPKTVWGLIQCFYMALPFWRNALLADILFAQIFRLGDILIGDEETARPVFDFWFALGDIRRIFLVWLFARGKHTGGRERSQD